MDLLVRFGGVEFNKYSHAGDVGILQHAKKGLTIEHAKRNVTESPLYDVFIEVKNRANPDVWGSILKAEDDADNAGKKHVLLYAIKQERGSKGKRLICMRPETFAYLIQKGR